MVDGRVEDIEVGMIGDTGIDKKIRKERKGGYRSRSK